MKKWIEKASHLIEALPYIRRFCGKIFVVKCGGAALVDPQQLHNIMQDIALLHFCGIRPVIVHGGGPDIGAMCKRLQIPTQFSNGLRVTDADTMEIVQMVLFGKTNRALVTALNQFGVKAVGLTGQDAAFMQSKKFIATSDVDADVDLGFVGEITDLDTTLITTLLAGGFLPVIAPIGIDEHGQAYNINADTAAGVVASKLAAEKLVMLSDVNGLYANIDDPETRLHVIKAALVKTWLNEKHISGGMIPKLQACLHALDNGLSSAHILDGNMPHSLLLEIFTDQGVGTLITN